MCAGNENEENDEEKREKREHVCVIYNTVCVGTYSDCVCGCYVCIGTCVSVCVCVFAGKGNCVWKMEIKTAIDGVGFL